MPLKKANSEQSEDPAVVLSSYGGPAEARDGKGAGKATCPDRNVGIEGLPRLRDGRKTLR